MKRFVMLVMIRAPSPEADWPARGLTRRRAAAQRTTRWRCPLRRLAVAASLAVLMLAASASPAGAAVTIGQVAPGSDFGFANSQVDYLQPAVTSGQSYAVPATGGVTSWRVTSWSHKALGDPGQMVTMKIFRKVAEPATYMVVSHDGPRSLTDGTLNTFAASIPVRAGDVLGLNTANASPTLKVAYGFPSPNREVFLERLDSDLRDGQSGAFDVLDSEFTRINVSAVVEPSNEFILNKRKRKKKARVKVVATLPNPGTFEAGDRLANGIGATAAAKKKRKPKRLLKSASKQVGAPGRSVLVLKPTKTAIKRLKRKAEKKGKKKVRIKAKIRIAFTPTFGSPSVQVAKVKLKR